MDVGTLLAVVAVVAVLLVLGAAGLVIARMPAAVRNARLAVVRADVALWRARGRHARLIRTAEREIARVERDHSSTLATLDRRIVALEDPRGQRLASFGPVTLHELRIITPAGEVPLDGARATVESAGQLTERGRTTLTRLAVGGAVLGPLGAILALGFPKRRTVDDRELYLLVEAGTASCVVQVRPDEGARLRAFAVQINAASNAVATRRGAIAAELADTRRRLAAVSEDHTALDVARARLSAAHADPGARAALARAEAELAAARTELADLQDGER